MSTNNATIPGLLEIIQDNDRVTDRVFVTLQGHDYSKELSYFGLDFDTDDASIMARVGPIVQEQFGEDIQQYYKVRKAVNNRNVYIIPNSTAG